MTCVYFFRILRPSREDSNFLFPPFPLHLPTLPIICEFCDRINSPEFHRTVACCFLPSFFPFLPPNVYIPFIYGLSHLAFDQTANKALREREKAEPSTKADFVARSQGCLFPFPFFSLSHTLSFLYILPQSDLKDFSKRTGPKSHPCSRHLRHL